MFFEVSTILDAKLTVRAAQLEMTKSELVVTILEGSEGNLLVLPRLEEMNKRLASIEEKLKK